MIGFVLMIGRQGSGKTLMATSMVFDEYHGQKVFSNYTLKGIDYKPITFNRSIEQNKDKIDILDMLDKNPDYFNDSIMVLDEIHLYLDSLDFMRTNNRKLQTFFSQLRKRNILLIGTTQYLMNVDIRIRRQCLNVIEMSNKGNGIFLAQTSEIDGYFSKPISEIYIDLRKWYNHYNTNELVL